MMVENHNTKIYRTLNTEILIYEKYKDVEIKIQKY